MQRGEFLTRRNQNGYVDPGTGFGEGQGRGQVSIAGDGDVKAVQSPGECRGEAGADAGRELFQTSYRQNLGSDGPCGGHARIELGAQPDHVLGWDATVEAARGQLGPALGHHAAEAKVLVLKGHQGDGR